jgi:acetoin utilization protein AcuB
MSGQSSPRVQLLQRLCDPSQRSHFSLTCFVASDVMTGPPVTVDAVLALRDVVALFPARHVRHIMVVKRGKLTGIISDRDVLKALWKGQGKLAGAASDIGTARPLTAAPRTPVETLASMMLNGKFSAVPIVDSSEQPLGIVSWIDLIWLLKLMQIANSTDADKRQSSLQREIQQLVTAEVLSQTEGDGLLSAARPSA